MAGIIAKHHHDEDAARVYLEAKLWPDGPVCPKCGLIGEAYRLEGETTRKGLYKCAGCREPFTVTMGTIFEDSHIPLHKWLFAIYLMCSSKKGMSAHQLWRNLWGVDETGRQLGSYTTAWFMCHRIRWALGQEPVATRLQGIVEIDEVYIGGKGYFGPIKDAQGHSLMLGRRSRRSHKAPVVAMLQRGGDVHSRHVERVTSDNLKPILNEVVDQNATLMTDKAYALKFPSKERTHYAVNHSAKEYVRHEDGLTITTNTIESYFAIIQRGIHGVYHHVGKSYLDQYLREFDFRYNVRQMNDQDRSLLAIQKTRGRRLMLKNPKGFKTE
jgi:transposase-like protein